MATVGVVMSQSIGSTKVRVPWKIVAPALFWGSITTLLAILYGESFWLWMNRAFELSFVLYVIAVFYALYFFLPRFGAVLGTSIMQGISQFFVKNKMTALGQKGVEARQEKALREGEIALVAADDPIKGMLAPYMADQIRHADAIPSSLRGVFADNAEKMLLNSQVNLTNWIVQGLDKKFPNLKLAEKINALGVITNAEKVA